MMFELPVRRESPASRQRVRVNQFLMAKADSLDSVNTSITDIDEKYYHIILDWPCCWLSSDRLFSCTSESLLFNSLGGRR
jgi:hypothetical protein